ncbi:fork head domain-containing protein [Dioszegia hungarica]|uniref:Fork head domain-containing protein n=1 Tax=Dioszegia hungarica TaxID=4972 RepID=A0AA38LYZ9_9TREE|nr:fork head domain-containing protein [Dioszegia hungarica]KAI9639901.1 fork head domain-containing protein [Dioszegia hungarica]
MVYDVEADSAHAGPSRTGGTAKLADINPAPASARTSIVRPSIANLLCSPPSLSNLSSQPINHLEKIRRFLDPPDNTLLTDHDPTDPTVLTFGLRATLPPPTLPPSGVHRTRPPPSPPPAADDRFNMTVGHVKAFRKFQLRRPTPLTIGKDGQRTRRLCIAEAAWMKWAEEGGRWNGGKEGTKGKKGKKGEKGKGRDEGEEEVVVGVKGCNAYSYDENGDPYKPTMSILEILRLVLATATEKMLTLPEIYQAVEARWPYFKTCTDSWKGSIRNNLSVHVYFEQVSREDEKGKPMKALWRVNEKLAGPLCPNAKESTKSHRPALLPPLLSTDLPPHPLHPSFAPIDPAFAASLPIPPQALRSAATANKKYTGTDVRIALSGPRELNPRNGRPMKYPTVKIPGKSMDFPMPGVPPHWGGSVPAGYPNPLPRGWMGMWGDPTLVDLGKRYGGDGDAGKSVGDDAGGLARLGMGTIDIEEVVDLPHIADTGPGIRRQCPSTRPYEPTRSGVSHSSIESFAPLSEFSAFLASSRPLSRTSSASSATSASSTRFSATVAGPPLHLPFLHLLSDPAAALTSSGSKRTYHPAPSLPPSTYNLPLPASLSSVHVRTADTDTPAAPSAGSGLNLASAHLRSRGAGFVPFETKWRWQDRSRTMEPFPGSGEWVQPKRKRGRAEVGDDEEEGEELEREREEKLPGIEAVLGPIGRGDPRATIPIPRQRMVQRRKE